MKSLRLLNVMVIVVMLLGILPVQAAPIPEDVKVPASAEPVAPPVRPPQQDGGPVAVLGAAPKAPAGQIQSLSGSNVVFDSSVGGATCSIPGAPQTFCFKAESFTNDWEYVHDLWVKFPTDWTVTNVYVQGTPSCDNGGSWGAFSWSFETAPYEVDIYHPRYQASTDHCTAYYCFDVTSGTGVPYAYESWYWDGDGYGSAPHNPCSDDNYTPAGQSACDEAINPVAQIPVCVLDPGVYLLPEGQTASGCNGVPQEHTLTLLNNTGADSTFVMTYTVLSGNGALTGPATVGPVSNGATQQFNVTLTPDLCAQSGAEVIARVDTEGNGYSDFALITKTVTTEPKWEAIPASAPGWPGYGYPRDGCTALNASGQWVTYEFGDTNSFYGFWGYNHTTNTWFQPNPTNTPADRWAPDWAYDPETNLCYVTGGATTPGGGNLNDAYVYDPVANAFTALGNFTSVRDFHNSWVGRIDGVKYLCIGGGVNASSVLVQSTQCYDLSQTAPGVWNPENAQMAPFPTDPFGAADGVLHAPTGDQFWYVGGAINNFNTVTDEARYWDDADNAWHLAGNTGVPRYRVEGDFFNGEFWQLGGSSGGFTPTSDVVRGTFDGVGWTWTVMPSLNNARMDNVVAVTEIPAGLPLRSISQRNAPRVTLPEGAPQSLTELVASGKSWPAVQPAAPTASTPRPQALTYYSNRGDFDADHPGLPVEDYENGSMAYGTVDAIPHPLDASSSNAYFDPGDILPGIQFWASNTHSGDEIAVLGEQFMSNPSKTAVANYFTDGYVIVFNPPVMAVGMDIQDFMGSYSCQVDIYDTNGLLASTTSACNEAGVFWGVASDANPITQIIITDLSGGAEGADNIAFGGALPGTIWSVDGYGNNNSAYVEKLAFCPVCDLQGWLEGTVLDGDGVVLNAAIASPFEPVKVSGGGVNAALAVASPNQPLVRPAQAANPQSVLWDQPLSSVNQNAYVDQDFTDYPSYSSFLADDFVNPMPWDIYTIFVPGNGWNGFTSLFSADALTWQIYADCGGVPCGDPAGGGTPPVWTLTLLPTDPMVTISNGSGGMPSDVTLNLPLPVTLPAGHWWLVFYPTMAFSGGGQYGRQPADTTNGYTGQFINPGGSFGYGTAWQAWTVLGATQQDIAFRLEGSPTSGVAPCTNATVTINPGNIHVAVDPDTGHYGPVQLISGTYTIEATAPGYSSATASVTILDEVTTTQDLVLFRPAIEITPTAMNVYAPPSTTVTMTLWITNGGHLPLDWEIREIPGTVQVAAGTYRQPPAAIGIDFEIYNQMSVAADGQAEFFIAFKDTADLSAAYNLTDKASKVQAVRQALREAGDRAQARVRAWLDSQGIEYKVFYIDNTILVKADRKVLDALREFPEVAGFHANHVYSLMPAPRLPLLVGPEQPAPQATIPWDITIMQIDRVWNELGVTGQGVIVANVDTGVYYQHEALYPNYLCGSGPHTDCWLDPDGGTTAPNDGNGHGTATMSQIAADNNPAFQYAVGGAPDAGWIACLGCPGGSCPDTALNPCADWLVMTTPHTPDLVNNSWGSWSAVCNPWYDGKIAAYRAAGIVPVWAAGNIGNACNTSTPPANSIGTLAVGATTPSDTQASFSSTGPGLCTGRTQFPDVSAPGDYTCGAVTNTTNGYDCGFGGTSFAAPRAAGCAALMKSANPALSVDDIINTLMATADDKPNSDCGSPQPDPNYRYGDGRVNCYEAVSAVSNMDIPWVVEAPVSGTLPHAGAQPITVTFHCTSAQEGFILNGTLRVVSNDPCNGSTDIPLVLTCGEPLPPEIEVSPLALTSIQVQNEVTTQTVHIDNLGTLALDWTIDEGCGAGDIPWAIVNPVSGTTPGHNSRPVAVAFDATGLAGGVYTGALCIESNDADEPVVTVTLEMTVLELQNIEVTPPGLDVTLCPTSTTTVPLEVCNLGDLPLDWQLAEMTRTIQLARRPFPSIPVPTVYDPAAVADLAGKAAPAGAAPDAASVRWSYPQAVLWDNGPLVTHPAGCTTTDASRLQTGLGMNTLGFGHQFVNGYRMSDDFTVSDPNGWNVDTITFFAYQTGAPSNPSPITGVYLQIWDGPPWVAGSNVIWGDLVTNRLLSSTFSGIQRDSETSPCANNRYIFANTAGVGVALPPGQYWLDWMTDGSGSYSGPWAPPVTILGQTTTGDAYQYTGSWAPALDSGTATQQGMPFIIQGAPALDIPWLSEDPTSGTVPGGECQVISVTFDSTGLALGEYHAALSIQSNDPDTPQVVVPVTMTVGGLRDVGFDWTPADPVLNEEVLFTAWASGGEPIAYEWDLGDGTTGSGITLTHVYTLPGNYVVTLTATNPCDHVVVTATVHVCWPPENADFTWVPDTPATGEEVTFYGAGQGENLHFAWDFGDGGFGAGDLVTHTYAASGDYTVVMTLTGDCGQEVVTKTLHVCEPVAGADFDWTPAVPLPDETVFFTGTATGDGLAYAWDFGDGEFGAGETPTHTYAVAGDYTVVMTVTGDCGEPQVVSKTLHVCEPVAGADFDWTPAVPLPDETVVFTGTATGDGLVYAWAFGDGELGVGENPTHTYTAAGNYTVVMTVTGDCGEPQVVSKTLAVEQPCTPLTSITIAGATSGYPGVYTFTTSYLPTNATPPITYLWDNGDTTANTTRMLSVGTYTLTVTATNCVNVQVVDTHVITINPYRLYLPVVMKNH